MESLHAQLKMEIAHRDMLLTVSCAYRDNDFFLNLQCLRSLPSPLAVPVNVAAVSKCFFDLNFLEGMGTWN